MPVNEKPAHVTRQPLEDISEVVLTQEQIQARVTELAAAISHDYSGLDPLMVGVLKGVIFFMSDLLRAISIHVEVDFLAIANYNSDARNNGYVRMVKDLDNPIANRHVIFVEDVIDTGLTINYLLKKLRDRLPASLEVCTIFNKPGNRLLNIPIKYKGFDIPDRFLVGYGLDYHEKYRNLPFLGLLKKNAL
jgi:hypoxanthine phosphoribosyltransferase